MQIGKLLPTNSSIIGRHVGTLFEVLEKAAAGTSRVITANPPRIGDVGNQVQITATRSTIGFEPRPIATA